MTFSVLLTETETNLLLVEDLHGIVAAALLVLDEHDSAETARTEGLNAVEVVQRRRVLKQFTFRSRLMYFPQPPSLTL